MTAPAFPHRTSLIVGATGATGRLLVAELLHRGQSVRAIVRSAESLPQELRASPNLTLTEASLLDLPSTDLAQLVAGCQAVASCLGHNLSFRGIFGPPHRLVTEATRRLCSAILEGPEPAAPTRFVLMNTVGNRNLDRDEPVSPAQHAVLGLLRILVPPHADNEDAANYLRTQIGSTEPSLEWTVVRPDSLIETGEASPYDVHLSPTRSAIFDAGKTSRINVAHFMAELISEPVVWNQWKGEMPVIYNRELDSEGSASSPKQP